MALNDDYQNKISNILTEGLYLNFKHDTGRCYVKSNVECDLNILPILYIEYLI